MKGPKLKSFGLFFVLNYPNENIKATSINSLFSTIFATEI